MLCGRSLAPRILTKSGQKTAAPLCRSAAAGMSNAVAYKSDHGECLLRSNPSRFEHVHAVIFGGWFNADDAFLLSVVEAVPYLTPIAAC
ncbi:MAG: hypothetical protein RLZZ61_1828 [Pseudomonadota bacterium]